VTGKEHASPSVLEPEALLREARRQKGMPIVDGPRVRVLDPNGDVVRHLKRTGASGIHKGTDLLTSTSCFGVTRLTNL
jgi:hypothetical protein